MIRRSFLSAAVLMGLVGCGGDRGRVADPAPVTGRIISADGNAVKDVFLTLQPVDSGAMAGLKVGGDGTFSGKVVPGRYAYFLGPQEGKGAAALKAVPEKYQTASMERTVQVRSGGELHIKLQ
jgi:hypothetical protein